MKKEILASMAMSPCKLCGSRNTRKITFVEKSNGKIIAIVPKRLPIAFGYVNKGCRPQIGDLTKPMTASSYRRTLNRKSDDLVKLDIDEDLCVFITLTIREEQHNNYEAIKTQFERFDLRMKRYAEHHHNYARHIRSIGVQPDSKRFHIHSVYVYEITPPILDEETIGDFWGLGKVHKGGDEGEDVYDVDGLFQYLTKYDMGAYDYANPGFTRFPKRAKIITWSPDLPKAKVYDAEWDECAIGGLIQKHEKGMRYRSHCYRDPLTKELVEVVDKRYLVIREKAGAK